MTMISLSAIPVDPIGVLRIDALPSSDLDNHASRASRVATLDGGAALSPYGFSDSDRTLLVVWKPTRDSVAAIQRMMRVYLQIRAITPDGVFRAAILSLDVSPKEVRAQVALLERQA